MPNELNAKEMFCNDKNILTINVKQKNTQTTCEALNCRLKCVCDIASCL